MLLDLAHDDALARRREPAHVAGHHGTGHLLPGAGLLEAGRGEPLLLARVVGVGAGVEQGRAHPAHAGDVDGVPLSGAEQRGGEGSGIRLGQVRGDGHLDEGAAGGSVVHRQPRDQPPVGVVDERLPPGPRADAGELAEHRLGVDTGRAVGGPLVRGEQARHVGGVGGVGHPGGQAGGEPVDRHVGVGHADHSRTAPAPRLAACDRKDTDDRHRRDGRAAVAGDADPQLGRAAPGDPGHPDRRADPHRVPAHRAVLQPLLRASPRSSATSTSPCSPGRCSPPGWWSHRWRCTGCCSASVAASCSSSRATASRWPGWRCSRSPSPGVVLLVVDVVVGDRAGWIAGGAILLVLTVLWAVVPRVADRLDPSPRNPPPSADDEPDA